VKVVFMGRLGGVEVGEKVVVRVGPGVVFMGGVEVEVKSEEVVVLVHVHVVEEVVEVKLKREKGMCDISEEKKEVGPARAEANGGLAPTAAQR